MNEDPSLNPEDAAKADRIAYLVSAFIRKEITPAETDELDEWVGESDHNVLLFEEMTDEKNIAQMMAVVLGVNADDAMERVNKKIAKQKKRSRKKKMLLVYSVAAMLGVIIFFMLITNNKKNVPAFVKTFPERNDIAPGSNKAVLTLSGGKKITLDTAENASPDLQDGGVIIKSDSGRLTYQQPFDIKNDAATLQYNTLTTPRGGQFQVMLPDGSKVWLNAVSSLKYPVAFKGNERLVELTGEGYFEVSKNPSKPFHVKVNGADVKVLGTHFNINAYSDENKIKATLLEGSVNITVQHNTAILKPGQEAEWSAASKISVLDDIDTSDAISWKDGMFSFHRSDIKSIMRQVEKWYDVKVQFNAQIKNHFTATIERDVPVSKLLKLLEGTGDVHFTVQDKTIFVNP